MVHDHLFTDGTERVAQRLMRQLNSGRSCRSGNSRASTSPPYRSRPGWAGGHTSAIGIGRCGHRSRGQNEVPPFDRAPIGVNRHVGLDGLGSWMMFVPDIDATANIVFIFIGKAKRRVTHFVQSDLHCTGGLGKGGDRTTRSAVNRGLDNDQGHVPLRNLALPR